MGSQYMKGGAASEFAAHRYRIGGDGDTIPAGSGGEDFGDEGDVLIPPGMNPIGQETLRDAIDFLTTLNIRRNRLRDSDLFHFVSVVHSSSRVPMTSLIEDYALMEKPVHLSSLLAGMGDVLAQSIAGGGGGDFGSASGGPGVGGPIVFGTPSSSSSSGSGGGIDIKGTPKLASMQQQPQFPQKPSTSLPYAGSNMTQVDGTYSATLLHHTIDELRANGLFLPLIAAYEERRLSSSVVELVRANDAMTNVRLTPVLMGTIERVLADLRMFSGLQNTVFPQYLPDSTVRTKLGSLVAAYMGETATLVPARDYLQVTHTRVVRSLKHLRDWFATAQLDRDNVVRDRRKQLYTDGRLTTQRSSYRTFIEEATANAQARAQELFSRIGGQTGGGLLRSEISAYY